jgi:hypothetical protein
VKGHDFLMMPQKISVLKHIIIGKRIKKNN